MSPKLQATGFRSPKHPQNGWGLWCQPHTLRPWGVWCLPSVSQVSNSFKLFQVVLKFVSKGRYIGQTKKHIKCNDTLHIPINSYFLLSVLHFVAICWYHWSLWYVFLLKPSIKYKPNLFLDLFPAGTWTDTGAIRCSSPRQITKRTHKIPWGCVQCMDWGIEGRPGSVHIWKDFAPWLIQSVCFTPLCLWLQSTTLYSLERW